MPLSMKPPVVYRKTKEKEGILDYQNFADHKGMAERFKKTLCYGKLPKTDRPSLPMTELAVELFSKAVSKAEGLGQIDMHYAASVSRNACMSPYSMILAIAYIERLKRKSPDYLRQVSSSDLFLVSMMVASKFLYDEGEDEEVFNEEWAKSANMETKEINYLERKFLAAIDWDVFLGTDGFLEILREMEFKIARRKSKAYGSCTYTDLTILLEGVQLLKCWHLLIDSFVKVFAVSVVAYSTSILTIVGAVIISHQAHLQAAQIVNRLRCSSDMAASLSSTPLHTTGLDSHTANDSDVFLSHDVLSCLASDDCHSRVPPSTDILSHNGCWSTGLSSQPCHHNAHRHRHRTATTQQFAPPPHLLDLSDHPRFDHRPNFERHHVQPGCCGHGVLRKDSRNYSDTGSGLVTSSFSTTTTTYNSADSMPPSLTVWSPYANLENVTNDMAAYSSLRMTRDWLYSGSPTLCVGPGLAAFR